MVLWAVTCAAVAVWLAVRANNWKRRYEQEHAQFEMWQRDLPEIQFSDGTNRYRLTTDGLIVDSTNTYWLGEPRMWIGDEFERTKTNNKPNAKLQTN